MPHLVQGHERRGSVRATPSQTTPQRNSLVKRNFGSRAGYQWPVSAPGPRGPRDPPPPAHWRGRRSSDGPIRAYRDIQAIAQVEKLKNGLQLVVTVGPAANHVQHQVQLGRRGPGMSSPARSRPPALDHQLHSRAIAFRGQPLRQRESQRRRARLNAHVPAVLLEVADLLAFRLVAFRRTRRGHT